MFSIFEERVHGGADVDALLPDGDNARGLIDFSVNLNPYGPCQPVLDAARSVRLDRYPDMRARAARGAWAKHLSVPIEDLAVGHGAADLFWAIGRALLMPGDRVVIAEPTFSEMRFVARAAGATVERAISSGASAFDLAGLVAQAKGARLLYLCSPNNPTGSIVRADTIRSLALLLPDVHIVLDQAFLSLSDNAADVALRFPDNVICVRSLTKDFALAGLRIAYLVAHAPLVERIERARPSWSTSASAQAAIVEAAQQDGFVRQCYARLRDDRAYLVRGLQALALAPEPSCTVYVLLPVGDAQQTCALLLTRGISVRNCTSFGLPAHVRVAVRPRADTDRLLDAFRSLTGTSGVRLKVWA